MFKKSNRFKNLNLRIVSDFGIRISDLIQCEVKDVLSSACVKARCPQNSDVSIIFVGDRRMRELNRIYRGKDKATNVLAFPTNATSYPAPEQAWYRAGKLQATSDLGDIFICYPQAKREAILYKLKIKEQIRRLALHGFLHLLGYDHQTVKERCEMERLEVQILC